jgi:hypothetical protein
MKGQTPVMVMTHSEKGTPLDTTIELTRIIIVDGEDKALPVRIWIDNIAFFSPDTRRPSTHCRVTLKTGQQFTCSDEYAVVWHKIRVAQIPKQINLG